ncbi:hypothetical protein [Pedobacter sp. ASV12]|uniref:hypothetical protein n=1 Tax=Pedobacter sp. ASV12 TaxID=2795120 RepID=UPI0018EA4A2E|nr:hypothetical protein [Pedobacter sp. ASV12]
MMNKTNKMKFDYNGATVLSRNEMKNIVGGVGPNNPRCGEICPPFTSNPEIRCVDECGDCIRVEASIYVCMVPLNEK